MQQILQQSQEDPRAFKEYVQERCLNILSPMHLINDLFNTFRHLKNPNVAANIHKLINAGVLRTA